MAQKLPRVRRGSLGQASPLNHVRRGLPLLLIIHGHEDERVPVGISVGFHEALELVGAPSALTIYTDAGHSDYVFAVVAEDDARIVDDTTNLVERCGR